MQAQPNPISNKEAFEKLPEDVKEAMTSIDSASVLQKISEENNLHLDQAGKLSDETGNLMMGITPPSDFIHNIQKQVKVDQETARKMAQKINNEIFKPIRDSLKKIHNIGPTTEAQAPSPENTQAEQSTKQSTPQNPPSPAAKTGKDPYREPIDDDDVF